MDTPNHQIAFQALANRLFLESIPEDEEWDAYSLIGYIDPADDSLTIVNFLYQGNTVRVLDNISPEAAALLVVWRLELPEAMQWHGCVVQIVRAHNGDIVNNALIMADEISGAQLRPTPENLQQLAIIAQP